MSKDINDIHGEGGPDPVTPAVVPAKGMNQTLWARARKYHLFWEITLALLLAVYFAYYYSGFDRPQYGLYILIGEDIPNTSGEAIRNALKRSVQNFRLNETDVNVNIIPVPVRGSRLGPDAALETAKTIVKNGDALLVVGYLIVNQPSIHCLCT